jgi:large subunit ribosomal protein L30
MAGKSKARVRLRWVRSGIAFNRKQKEMIHSLGLRRLHQVVERDDSPVVRGLIAKVAHLVEVVGPAPASVLASLPEYTIIPPSASPAVTEAAKPEVPETPPPPAEETPAEAAVAAEAPVEEAAAAPKRRVRRKPAVKKAAKSSGATGESSDEAGS